MGGQGSPDSPQWTEASQHGDNRESSGARPPSCHSALPQRTMELTPTLQSTLSYRDHINNLIDCKLLLSLWEAVADTLWVTSSVACCHMVVAAPSRVLFYVTHPPHLSLKPPMSWPGPGHSLSACVSQCCSLWLIFSMSDISAPCCQFHWQTQTPRHCTVVYITCSVEK